MKRFRPSRPANESQRVNELDWGVYDSRSGLLVTEGCYTKAFARILAAGMNWAYEEGMKQ